MTTYNAEIVNSAGDPPVIMDDVQIRREITGLTLAQRLAKAWFTVKQSFRQADADAIMQLEITTVPAPEGQITDDGDGKTTAEIQFRVAGAATYENVVADKVYVYDIQLLLTDGTIGTLETGEVTWTPEVTRATA